MRALVVGGTFDHEHGKPSKIVAALAAGLGWPCLNGGSMDQLRNLNARDYDTLLWMPNIDNAEEKILPALKKQNPALLLISSKRVVEKSYTPFDVISRLLKTHSNLGIMIDKPDDKFRFRLMDPLGNQYCDTTDISTLTASLSERVADLKSMTRIGSEQIDAPVPEIALPDGFVTVVRRLGDIFSEHVNAANPERFLGNAAARPTDRITRCCHGFPSVRNNTHYAISRRNVDKVTMSEADFVAVENDEGKVRYYGTNKPSVDSPIQIRLLNHFRNVNFIVHGHTYVADAPMTHSKIPCGHIEEFDEIKALVPDPEASNFSVNLQGHGCLLFARDMDYLNTVKFTPRPFPEV